MSNLRIFDLNQWDSQILEGTGYDTGWPYTNTQQRWKTKSCRLTGITSKYIRTAGSTALTANAFFIFFHNITASGTVTVKGSNNNWGTTPFSQAMTRTANLFVYVSPTLLTYDDFGFYVDDATNTDGYLELGRIWLGEYYQETAGYSPDIQETQEDPSAVMESTGGQVSILEREKFKTWLMPFDCIYNKTRYDTFINRVGTSKEFVIVKQPTGHQGTDFPTPENYSFYVSLTSHDEKLLAGTLYSAILKIKEER